MPAIKLTNITKRWGTFYAVENLNLTIDDNAFVTLLGPSGCGKTTTLRMIAGLETPTSGRITIGDKVVFDSEMGINVPANKRKVGFLFQNYALWPNMTVYQNISFGLGNVKEEMPQVDFEAREAAKIQEILSHPQAVLDAVNECYDKDGKLDHKKLNIRLIDTFTISTYTAKKLESLNLQDAKDLNAACQPMLAACQSTLDKSRAEAEKKGLSLNEKYEYTKNGQVVTSVRKYTKEETDLIVRRVSRIVKIGIFMDRYPAELSGGQQQRVAIARTLAPDPEVLFMDEPLSNLDAKLRLEMRAELQRLHIETGRTFVYVTHDQMEAMTLATKICLMDNGVLQQYDAPLTVYGQPKNTFVADFVGNPAVNFVEARGQQGADGSVALEILNGVQATYTFKTPVNLEEWGVQEEQAESEKRLAYEEAKKDKHFVEKGNKDTLFKYVIHHAEDVLENETPDEVAYLLGVRPETMKICEDENGLEAEVYSAMPTGMETTIRVKVDNFVMTGVVFGGVTYSIGQKVHIRFEGSIMFFDRKSGKLVGTGELKLH